MSGFLDQVAAQTRKRVEGLKRSQPLATLGRRPPDDPIRPLAASLRRVEGLSLIAELKQSSPSAGLIRKKPTSKAAWRLMSGRRRRAFDPDGGILFSRLTPAAGLARRTTRLPLLRKDFIVDEYQILESRSLGADAILLIAALLSDSQLKEFCRRRGKPALTLSSKSMMKKSWSGRSPQAPV